MQPQSRHAAHSAAIGRGGGGGDGGEGTDGQQAVVMLNRSQGAVVAAEHRHGTEIHNGSTHWKHNRPHVATVQRQHLEPPHPLR